MTKIITLQSSLTNNINDYKLVYTSQGVELSIRLEELVERYEFNKINNWEIYKSMKTKIESQNKQIDSLQKLLIEKMEWQNKQIDNMQKWYKELDNIQKIVCKNY